MKPVTESPRSPAVAIHGGERLAALARKRIEIKRQVDMTHDAVRCTSYKAIAVAVSVRVATSQTFVKDGGASDSRHVWLGKE